MNHWTLSSLLHTICSISPNILVLMFVGVSSDDSHEDQIMIKGNLVSAFKINLDDKLKAELQGLKSNQFQDGLEDKQFGRWSTTWWQQFSVLFRRGVKERKHESFSGLKIGQVVVVAFLSGLLWWQSDVSHLQDQVPDLFSMYFAQIQEFCFS